MLVEKVFNIMGLVQRLTGIERSVKLVNRASFENDAEHSYEIAMVCWYLLDTLNLTLNKELVLKYALVHDLVEVYAGDTDPYTDSAEFIASKAVREHEAYLEISGKYQDFPEMLALIESYEKKSDGESTFVYLVDKVLPVMNTYISGQDYYKQNNVSYTKWDDLLKSKETNVTFPAITPFFDELRTFLKDHQSEIFAD